MLKLSKLTDYAVVILAAMAGGGRERPFSASGVAAATFLPEPTVSKILKLLAKAGIITSIRGAKGGYTLNEAPENIPVGRVIAALEGPVRLASCVKDSGESCGIESICMLHGRWNPVNAAIETALSNVSLADMIPALKGRQGIGVRP